MDLEKSTLDKFERLKEYLKRLEKFVVAFSGGVDSTFLLTTASQIIPNSILAVTAKGPIYPGWETETAVNFLKKHNIKYRIINYNPLSDPEFYENQPQRCYHCKKRLFTILKGLANNNGYPYVLDGTNSDDVRDFRPGLKALEELGIVSPLKEVGFTKIEIRLLSKDYFNLPTSEQPSMACLATRIPYGDSVTAEKLKNIERIELHLLSLGFSNFRARIHGDLLRIEIPENDIKKITDKKISKSIIELSKNIGFTYVTIDLEGYRSGSLNEELFKRLF